MSDEANVTTGPNIVLRDHDDTPVEHEFPAKLQVDTADGGTTKYVHESLVAEPVEKTVELDFSGGDMTVTPEEGQVFSEVQIPIPKGLTPANIPKGMYIAGVGPGALEAGGSAVVPYPFVMATVRTGGGYYGGTQYIGLGAMSNTLPVGADVLGVFRQVNSSYNSTQDTSHKVESWYVDSVAVTPTETEDGVQLSLPQKTALVSKYYAISQTYIVVFTVPEIFATTNDDGTLTIHASAAFLSWPTKSNHIFAQKVSVVDLSECEMTALPNMKCTAAHTVILPPTLTSLNSASLYNDTIRIIDASRAAAVPTVPNATTLPTNVEAILVPTALYEEWIASEYWADHADCIVAV